MKKKFALLLSVLSVVMMLSACGTQDPTTVDYNGVSYQELYQESLGLGTALADSSVEEIQQEKVYLQESYGDSAALYVELCDKWLAAMEESGAFVDVAKDGFTITKSGKTLTTDLILVFEERNVTFQLVYNYHNMELTGVTVEPVYELGERMIKAALNTVICMSIVFAVLIFISLIISCFNIFPYLEAKKKGTLVKKAAEKDTVVTQIGRREEQALADDVEIAIVLAAAIEEYEASKVRETTPTDGFVVRSIRRR